MFKKLMLLSFIIVLSGCSAIQSIKTPSQDSSEGLTYFMPKKDFLVTVKVELVDSKNEVTKISLGVGAAYPDLKEQYTLLHGANIFGKNTLKVEVSEHGLLTSTKSTTISKVSDAIKNLASSAGAVSGRNKVNKIMAEESAPELIDTCLSAGDHVFSFSSLPKSGFMVCGDIEVTITKHDSNLNVKGNFKVNDTAYSGLFYRQSEPYLMKAQNSDFNVSALVFSPSDAPVHFLPISRTFFANNEADIGFKDGMPTKYNQETDGEAIALLKLPAEIISAYFTAVGSVFDSFKSNDTKETAALNESLKLQLAKRKYEACIAAIEKKDDDLLESLGCKSN